jgi:hypothetical protein
MEEIFETKLSFPFIFGLESFSLALLLLLIRRIEVLEVLLSEVLLLEFKLSEVLLLEFKLLKFLLLD